MGGLLYSALHAILDALLSHDTGTLQEQLVRFHIFVRQTSSSANRMSQFYSILYATRLIVSVDYGSTEWILIRKRSVSTILLGCRQSFERRFQDLS